MVSKFCIFVVWNSRRGIREEYPIRCELVSKFCIFVVWNSIALFDPEMSQVVNWFQNFVSLWSETVNGIWRIWGCLLWIGFKILYLCGLKQSSTLKLNIWTGCELVSKFCIFVVWNSVAKTTGEISMLWIGFKILYLCGLKQSELLLNFYTDGCELVSKFCIFVVWNSLQNILNRHTQVVNWFQNFVSLWSETVKFHRRSLIIPLWIGFKILYLCGLKQLFLQPKRWAMVVNWFQNFVSLWSETVQSLRGTGGLELWIGFKILYLCGLKQSKGNLILNLPCCELVSKFCIFVVWNSSHQ